MLLTIPIKYRCWTLLYVYPMEYDERGKEDYRIQPKINIANKLPDETVGLNLNDIDKRKSYYILYQGYHFTFL